MNFANHKLPTQYRIVHTNNEYLVQKGSISHKGMMHYVWQTIDQFATVREANEYRNELFERGI